jgi:hypothetical protein
VWAWHAVATVTSEGGQAAGSEARLSAVDAAGLSAAEAAERLTRAGRPARHASSRSYASIVRANVLTVFNLILAGFGVVTLVFGDPRDALFLGAELPSGWQPQRRRTRRSTAGP